MKNKGITWDEIIFEKENHHIYHACSGFYGSGFDEAVALVLDGGGSIYENEEDILDFLGPNSRNCFRELETIFKVDYKSGISTSLETLWVGLNYRSFRETCEMMIFSVKSMETTLSLIL